MSAKNAPGEVNNKGLFGSPNITSSEEDITSEVDKAAEEQKKRETVDIDGVPIDEKDIKYFPCRCHGSFFDRMRRQDFFFSFSFF